MRIVNPIDAANHHGQQASKRRPRKMLMEKAAALTKGQYSFGRRGDQTFPLSAGVSRLALTKRDVVKTVEAPEKIGQKLPSSRTHQSANAGRGEEPGRVLCGPL